MKRTFYVCFTAVVLSGLTLAQPCTTTAVAPWCEDFNAANTLPANWVRSTTTAPDWRVTSGATTSANTGPTDDCTGGGRYAFVETSGSTAMSITSLTAPCTDVSGLDADCLYLYFCYHMWFNGAPDGTLNVDVSTDAGATWTTVWTRTGDQGGNIWHQAAVQLTSAQIQAGTLQFRFWFQTGSTALTFEYDVAIDDVCVEEGLRYQINQPEATLSNRVGTVTTPEGVGASPAVTRVCINEDVCLDLESTLGQVYDVYVQAGPASPNSGPGFSLPDCQTVNVDLSLPCPDLAFWLIGDMGNHCQPNTSQTFPTPIQSFCFNVGNNPFVASAQMYVLDPTAPFGIRLSQPVELRVGPTVGTVAGPTADDGCVEVDLGCEFLSFCGQSYSRINVGANGRVLFGACDTDFSPTVTEARNDAPFIGFWTDLHPGQGSGSISIDVSTTRVRVDYMNVPYRNDAVGTASFYIELFPNGNATLGGLSGILPSATSGTAYAQFLGMSCGNLVSGGALDPGPQTFCAGTSGGSPTTAPGSMLYDFYNGTFPPGLVPSLNPLGPCATSLPDTISFVWDPVAGAYSWSAN